MHFTYFIQFFNLISLFIYSIVLLANHTHTTMLLFLVLFLVSLENFGLEI